jgi:micrococcal nuclease
MKKSSLIFLSGIIISSWISCKPAIYGKVIGIKDGDTIEVLTSEKRPLIIRLNGIDAPEKKQAYGQKSKENLSNLIFGKRVKVLSVGHDRYGRLLADIFLDGKNVNYLQVSEGFAWHYKKYSKDKNLKRLENKARNDNLGLWKDQNPIPPWDFRKTREGELNH